MNFIQETIKRFFSANPKYFKIINIILTITVLVAGLPSFLSQFSIVLPDWATILENKTVAIAALVGRLLTQLTTTNKSILAKNSTNS